MLRTMFWAFLFFISSTKHTQGFDFTLVNPRTNQNVKLSADNSMVEGDLNAKVVLVEFKAYYCAPCKKLKEDVLDEVHHYFEGLSVAFVMKWARIGQDEPLVAKTLCAGRGGSPVSLIAKHLFRNQSLSESQFLALFRPIESVYQDCMNSGEGSSYARGDFSDLGTAGVQYVPTLFLQGRQIARPGSAGELISKINSLL